MASLGMSGPYPLSNDAINQNVTKTSPGNYALGYINNEKSFIVQYVGRADRNIADRLKQHVGEKYMRFKYSYAESPKAAFEKECRNYHDFGENKSLDNDIHPRRPDRTGWKCPYCDVFD